MAKKEPEIQSDAQNGAASLAPACGGKETGKKQHRTPGLQLFDVGLYPFFTNFVVFAMSVGATYLTARGGDRNAAGKLIYGKTGDFFHKRGNWLVDQFKRTGMTHEQADMSKMVFFSFADGSLIAPLVKLFEDRRERIAQWIDKKLGTEPENRDVYDAEPKQSWMSVLGGRLATCMIVVPTAYVLDKRGLNKTMFIDPGIKAGKYIAGKPAIAKWFGKLDIAELSKVSVFEAFYTSVCTAGLYLSSRCIASFGGSKKHPHMHQEEAPPPEPAVTVAPPPAAPKATPQPKHDGVPDTLAACTQVETGTRRELFA